MNLDRLKFAAAVLQGAPSNFGDYYIGMDPSKWVEEGRAARRAYEAQMAAAGNPRRISTNPLEVSIGSNDPLQTLILTALASYAEEYRAIDAANPNPQFSRHSTALDDRNNALMKAVAEARTRTPTLVEQAAYNEQRLADLRAGKP